MKPSLHQLNFHHLHYFWTVAREGGVTRAAARLFVSPSTISGQLHELEQALGEPLFARVGRRLELTEVGSVVLRYADEIFSLGQELVETLHGQRGGRPVRLVVGVDDVLPKLLVRRLLAPAFSGPDALRVVVLEAPLRELVTQLGQHSVDVVFSDGTLPPGSRIKAYSHLLGESGVGWFSAQRWARLASRGFPASLASVPLLLATEESAQRRELDAWLEARGIRPTIAAEVADSALMKSLGQMGVGVFPAPVALRRDIERQYDVRMVGESEGLRVRFYAISAERRIRNPAVVAMQEEARERLFP
jgi:LysR family transcriptional activator of nhaA